MTIIYSTTGEWGAGIGGPLTAAQIDGNFYDLVQRVITLEDEPLEPTRIASIEMVGSQFTVTLTDARVEGPFPLPLALFTWRGEWAAGEDYEALDVFFVDSVGVYVVLQDHTSATEFDAQEANTEGPYYHLMFRDSAVYDLAYYVPGIPGEGLDVGSPIFQVVIPRNIVLPETSTEVEAGRAYLATPVGGTDDFEAIIRKNGTQIGTIDIPTGSTVGTVTIDALTAFVPGDILSIDQPTPEGDGADLSITLSAVRGGAIL